MQDMLDGLTLERDSVKVIMGFAMDNAEASEDIVNILTEALVGKVKALSSSYFLWGGLDESSIYMSTTYLPTEMSM